MEVEDVSGASLSLLGIGTQREPSAYIESGKSFFRFSRPIVDQQEAPQLRPSKLWTMAVSAVAVLANALLCLAVPLPFLVPAFLFELFSSATTAPGSGIFLTNEVVRGRPWLLDDVFPHMEVHNQALMIFALVIYCVTLFELTLHTLFYKVGPPTMRALQRGQSKYLLRRLFQLLVTALVVLCVACWAGYIVLVGVWVILGAVLNPDVYLPYASATATAALFIYAKYQQLWGMRARLMASIRERIFERLQSTLEMTLGDLSSSGMLDAALLEGKVPGVAASLSTSTTAHALLHGPVGNRIASVVNGSKQAAALMSGEAEAVDSVAAKLGLPPPALSLIISFATSGGNFDVALRQLAQQLGPDLPLPLVEAMFDLIAAEEPHDVAKQLLHSLWPLAVPPAVRDSVRLDDVLLLLQGCMKSDLRLGTQLQKRLQLHKGLVWALDRVDSVRNGKLPQWTEEDSEELIQALPTPSDDKELKNNVTLLGQVFNCVTGQLPEEGAQLLAGKLKVPAVLLRVLPYVLRGEPVGVRLEVARNRAEAAELGLPVDRLLMLLQLLLSRVGDDDRYWMRCYGLRASSLLWMRRELATTKIYLNAVCGTEEPTRSLWQRKFACTMQRFKHEHPLAFFSQQTKVPEPLLRLLGNMGDPGPPSLEIKDAVDQELNYLLAKLTPRSVGAAQRDRMRKLLRIWLHSRYRGAKAKEAVEALPPDMQEIMRFKGKGSKMVDPLNFFVLAARRDRQVARCCRCLPILIDSLPLYLWKGGAASRADFLSKECKVYYSSPKGSNRLLDSPVLAVLLPKLRPLVDNFEDTKLWKAYQVAKNFGSGLPDDLPLPASAKQALNAVMHLANDMFRLKGLPLKTTLQHQKPDIAARLQTLAAAYGCPFRNLSLVALFMAQDPVEPKDLKYVLIKLGTPKAQAKRCQRMLEQLVDVQELEVQTVRQLVLDERRLGLPPLTLALLGVSDVGNQSACEQYFLSNMCSLYYTACRNCKTQTQSEREEEFKRILPQYRRMQPGWNLLDMLRGNKFDQRGLLRDLFGIEDERVESLVELSLKLQPGFVEKMAQSHKGRKKDVQDVDVLALASGKATVVVGGVEMSTAFAMSRRLGVPECLLTGLLSTTTGDVKGIMAALEGVSKEVGCSVVVLRGLVMAGLGRLQDVEEVAGALGVPLRVAMGLVQLCRTGGQAKVGQQHVRQLLELLELPVREVQQLLSWVQAAGDESDLVALASSLNVLPAVLHLLSALHGRHTGKLEACLDDACAALDLGDSDAVKSILRLACGDPSGKALGSQLTEPMRALLRLAAGGLSFDANVPSAASMQWQKTGDTHAIALRLHEALVRADERSALDSSDSAGGATGADGGEAAGATPAEDDTATQVAAIGALLAAVADVPGACVYLANTLQVSHIDLQSELNCLPPRTGEKVLDEDAAFEIYARIHEVTGLSYNVLKNLLAFMLNSCGETLRELLTGSPSLLPTATSKSYSDHLSVDDLCFVADAAFAGKFPPHPEEAAEHSTQREWGLQLQSQLLAGLLSRDPRNTRSESKDAASHGLYLLHAMLANDLNELRNAVELWAGSRGIDKEALLSVLLVASGRSCETSLPILSSRLDVDQELLQPLLASILPAQSLRSSLNSLCSRLSVPVDVVLGGIGALRGDRAAWKQMASVLGKGKELLEDLLHTPFDLAHPSRGLKPFQLLKLGSETVGKARRQIDSLSGGSKDDLVVFLAKLMKYEEYGVGHLVSAFLNAARKETGRVKEQALHLPGLLVPLLAMVHGDLNVLKSAVVQPGSGDKKADKVDGDTEVNPQHDAHAAHTALMSMWQGHGELDFPHLSKLLKLPDLSGLLSSVTAAMSSRKRARSDDEGEEEEEKEDVGVEEAKDAGVEESKEQAAHDGSALEFLSALLTGKLEKACDKLEKMRGAVRSGASALSDALASDAVASDAVASSSDITLTVSTRHLDDLPFEMGALVQLLNRFEVNGPCDMSKVSDALDGVHPLLGPVIKLLEHGSAKPTKKMVDAVRSLTDILLPEGSADTAGDREIVQLLLKVLSSTVADEDDSAAEASMELLKKLYLRLCKTDLPYEVDKLLKTLIIVMHSWDKPPYDRAINELTELLPYDKLLLLGLAELAQGKKAGLVKLLSSVTKLTMEDAKQLVSVVHGLLLVTKSPKEQVGALVKKAPAMAAEQLKGITASGLFRLFDRDNSGTVSFNEFHLLLKFFRVHMPRHQAMQLYSSADTDGSGLLSESEFVAVMATLQDQLLESLLHDLGVSTSVLLAMLLLLLTWLLGLFVFIFLGVAGFTTGTSFGAVINSLLPASVGGVLGRETEMDNERRTEKSSAAGIAYAMKQFESAVA
eukprot:PLAT3808.1.p1 GENE.PLAT3808.1~~PLAT3808.1.p1  ORF type:complete len:2608 (+),score=704.23 PLAT3808.1:801-7826(+)